MKVVQIAGIGNVLAALTEEGRIFMCANIGDGDWRPVPLPNFDKIEIPKSKTDVDRERAGK